MKIIHFYVASDPLSSPPCTASPLWVYGPQLRTTALLHVYEYE